MRYTSSSRNACKIVSCVPMIIALCYRVRSWRACWYPSQKPRQVTQTPTTTAVNLTTKICTKVPWAESWGHWQNANPKKPPYMSCTSVIGIHPHLPMMMNVNAMGFIVKQAHGMRNISSPAPKTPNKPNPPTTKPTSPSKNTSSLGILKEKARTLKAKSKRKA
jgi:hypothetical protein